eukprot:766819-Hanusia_phi.AAC.5
MGAKMDKAGGAVDWEEQGEEGEEREERERQLKEGLSDEEEAQETRHCERLDTSQGGRSWDVEESGVGEDEENACSDEEEHENEACKEEEEDDEEKVEEDGEEGNETNVHTEALQHEENWRSVKLEAGDDEDESVDHADESYEKSEEEVEHEHETTEEEEEEEEEQPCAVPGNHQFRCEGLEDDGEGKELKPKQNHYSGMIKIEDEEREEEEEEEEEEEDDETGATRASWDATSEDSMCIPRTVEKKSRRAVFSDDDSDEEENGDERVDQSADDRRDDEEEVEPEQNVQQELIHNLRRLTVSDERCEVDMEELEKKFRRFSEMLRWDQKDVKYSKAAPRPQPIWIVEEEEEVEARAGGEGKRKGELEEKKEEASREICAKSTGKKKFAFDLCSSDESSSSEGVQEAPAVLLGWERRGEEFQEVRGTQATPRRRIVLDSDESDEVEEEEEEVQGFRGLAGQGARGQEPSQAGEKKAQEEVGFERPAGGGRNATAERFGMLPVHLVVVVVMSGCTQEEEEDEKGSLDNFVVDDDSGSSSSSSSSCDDKEEGEENFHPNQPKGNRNDKLVTPKVKKAGWRYSTTQLNCLFLSSCFTLL